jgi:hypothetical protein
MKMIDDFDTQGQTPPPLSGKLVLPPPPEDNYSMPLPPIASSSRQMPAIRPEQLIRPQAVPLPKSPVAKLRYFWGKDPAYKVLIIAVGTVLLAGLLSISLVANAMLRNPNLLGLNGTNSQETTMGASATGTVDLHPAFPTPGGNNGSTTTSQPPAHATPTFQDNNPTPTVEPSPTTPSDGKLTVQITDIPDSVSNNSTVDVGVQASEANVSVALYVLYNASPYRDFAGPRTTDDNGDVTLPWRVSVYKVGGAHAMVFAVARDQQGHQAQSQAVSVQIVGFGE